PKHDLARVEHLRVRVVGDDDVDVRIRRELGRGAGGRLVTIRIHELRRRVGYATEKREGRAHSVRRFHSSISTGLKSTHIADASRERHGMIGTNAGTWEVR